MFNKAINRLRSLPRSEQLLIGLFFLTLPILNPYIRGDGNGYFAYIRSIVIDHDLKFNNEFQHGDPAFKEYVFDTDGQLRPNMTMPTGYVKNQWATGSSLLWLPFFISTHVFVTLANRIGCEILVDGYSAPYRWVCGLATVFYGFIGLLLAYRIARKFTNSLSAFLATVAIWFASPLPVYLYFLPFHVPALASFSVALLIWYWLRKREPKTILQWAVWGGIGGLVVSVYYLDAIFIFIPFAEWVKVFLSAWQAKDKARELRISLIKGSIFTGSLFLGLTPNFIIKWRVHGSPLNTGYSDEFFWDSPRLWQVGFSTEHGMFLWTPILLIAIIGFFLLWRREKWIGGILLIVFIIFYYFVACYQNWHGQSSFGNRFFVAFTPIFILGAAISIQKILELFSQTSLSDMTKPMVYKEFRKPIIIVSIFFTMLIMWNIGFIFQWGTNIVPSRGMVDFSQVAKNQVTVVPKKMVGFVFRYLKSRDQVTKEVEQEDLKEIPEYNLRR